ncbi:hypothetical protein SBRY_10456 [Actinacidiphila bryophytorum]|uniref:Uncharacterized protein n=1 Tax=Actinacidiphila bryophytorum TaxID=1436133 RepID=A0A9W4GWT8_9ACTN|nr:hypothetical protein SBRY_10456 [Actinacidiphila bryophytorum]
MGAPPGEALGEAERAVPRAPGGVPSLRRVRVFQGRGERRDQPPAGARVVTGPKGLFGPKPDHPPVGG